jgi:crotonobetainyl-CoA:carnitine CoA-transferase CaiB-like acyl-CoA transferase
MPLPMTFDGELFRSSRHAPRLGEHTRDVLVSVGFSEEEIERMLTEKVVAQA